MFFLFRKMRCTGIISINLFVLLQRSFRLHKNRGKEKTTSQCFLFTFVGVKTCQGWALTWQAEAAKEIQELQSKLEDTKAWHTEKLVKSCSFAIAECIVTTGGNDWGSLF